MQAQDMLEELRSKKGFICDMDGVIYHGNRLLPGVKEFVDWLYKEKKRFLFLTNSSERSPLELQQKLARMGLEVDESHFYTSALATAKFLKYQAPGCSAYVIGAPGLVNALYDAGITMNDVNPDYVIVGETNSYNYNMIIKAVGLINNGARQTGQQWATDHAPEVDINESGNILVIKGADGVRYGSDALGGIIVMEQPPFAFGQEHPKGRIATFYGSNGHRYAATGSLEGTLPFLRNIAWRMQGTYSNSGDRSTAHYLLNNTGTRGLHFSASAGYDSGRLRIEGIYSHFGEQTGVMFGAQMGSEDLLAERIRLGRPVYTDPFTRHISYPYQKVVHRTAIGKVRYNAGAAGVFYWQTSWQKDDRRENRIRRMNHSDIPAVALLLSSIQNTFRWK